MYFVNREDAVKQLQTICESKYYRAVGGAGYDWVIPLVDHVCGLGKSAFGRHFNQKSRETWPKASKRTPFQKTLCDCHSIFITFPKGALRGDSFEAVLIKFLINELKPMFQVEPDILFEPPKTTNKFLRNLTEAVGPLFIVLDGIGTAFSADDLTDLEQRDKFVSFCTNVVGTWQSLAKVFFVLAGRGAFLTYVGRRPDNGYAMYTTFKFERLKLNLLRPNAIKDILINTMMSNDMSIYAGLGLNDTTALTVTERLFNQTNGHPRTLLQAFKQCSSVEDLLGYKEAFPLEDWNLVKFYDDLVRNQKQVLRLLHAADTQSPINMLQIVDDSGGRGVPRDFIAHRFYVYWEGTAQAAQVYIQPLVKSYMEGWLLPFSEYIQRIGNSLEGSVDYPNTLEWIFIKRFQEALSTKSQPRLAMPDFFDTPIFGSCEDVAFSMSTRPMRTIDSNENIFLDLHSPTASLERLTTLQEMTTSLRDVCLKTLSKSAWSGGLFVTKATFRDDEVKVVCGLAVKNDTTVTDDHLSKQCDIFNRMLSGIDSVGYLRILFVCCTSYSEDISAKFKGKSHFVYECKKSFPNIDEAILLNLETPQQRAAFFGVDDDLAAIVEGVVRKAEVE
ncbi:hypothetical protein AC1031_008090 [Aphanomyces cochlioides]|nr:hypothetical protein AC1031_008090 [Aphanomyces cochlioides]